MLEGGREESLPLASLEADGGTQVRVAISDEAVANYRAMVEEKGKQLGRLWVVRGVAEDGAPRDWLTDGFHRRKAYMELGIDLAECLVWDRPDDPYTLHDARRMALAANVYPGVLLTDADNRKRIIMAVTNPQMAKKSSRALAAELGVSHTTVQKVRESLDTGGTGEAKPSGRPKGSGGSGGGGAERDSGSPDRGPRLPASMPDAEMLAPVLDSIPKHLRDIAADGRLPAAIRLAFKAKEAFLLASRSLDGPGITGEIAKILKANPWLKNQWAALAGDGMRNEGCVKGARKAIDIACDNIDQVVAILEHSKFHSVCARCEGKGLALGGSGGCPWCEGSGWLPEWRTPEKMAAMRGVVGGEGDEASGEDAA